MDHENIKITTPDDFCMVCALLMQKRMNNYYREIDNMWTENKVYANDVVLKRNYLYILVRVEKYSVTGNGSNRINRF